MGTARAATRVPLTPEQSYELWTDVTRWPTFIDGFGRAERLDDGWPEKGATIVWEGVRGGRGTVTEKVVRAESPVVHEVNVVEEKMAGTQRVTFETDEEEGTIVRLVLVYGVFVGGPFRPLVDALFIRRAQNDALARTLRRFRTEAAEQAAL
jgi:uncharacterized membrane protein